jgi:hypothetical protein
MKTAFLWATLLLSWIIIFSSCTDNASYLTQKQSSIVKDSVQQMTESIARNVTKEGPVAWLRYFENSTDFFMASEGNLVFLNYDSASNIINTTLVKTISKIELHWNNIRIDPLNNNLACIAAGFHEDLTDYAGKKTLVDGYFTGITKKTSQGWKLHNAHWSVLANH